MSMLHVILPCRATLLPSNYILLKTLHCNSRIQGERRRNCWFFQGLRQSQWSLPREVLQTYLMHTRVDRGPFTMLFGRKINMSAIIHTREPWYYLAAK